MPGEKEHQQDNDQNTGGRPSGVPKPRMAETASDQREQQQNNKKGQHVDSPCMTMSTDQHCKESANAGTQDSDVTDVSASSFRLIRHE
jgi:hypothetical protein